MEGDAKGYLSPGRMPRVHPKKRWYVTSWDEKACDSVYVELCSYKHLKDLIYVYIHVFLYNPISLFSWEARFPSLMLQYSLISPFKDICSSFIFRVCISSSLQGQKTATSGVFCHFHPAVWFILSIKTTSDRFRRKIKHHGLG